MSRTDVIEIMNGAIATGGVFLMIVILRYVMSPLASQRGKRNARAIGVFVVGETIITAWQWLRRHQLNDNIDPSWMDAYPVTATGKIIVVIGLFCMLRVFSQSAAPDWVWAGFMTAVVAVMAALAFGGPIIGSPGLPVP